MKLLSMTIIYFLICSATFAGEKFLCSALTLHKYKTLIPKTEFDKVKHCSYSCILSKRCGAIESFSVGLAKEIADLLGYGTPDLEDIEANRQGIRLGKEVESLEMCLPLCRKYYDNGSI